MIRLTRRPRIIAVDPHTLSSSSHSHLISCISPHPHFLSCTSSSHHLLSCTSKRPGLGAGHSGCTWTKGDFDKAEAEVKAQQREGGFAREGDKQVVTPLQRGNKQHSAAVQETMDAMERELDALTRDACKGIIIVSLYTMHCVL